MDESFLLYFTNFTERKEGHEPPLCSGFALNHNIQASESGKRHSNPSLEAKNSRVQHLVSETQEGIEYISAKKIQVLSIKSN